MQQRVYCSVALAVAASAALGLRLPPSAEVVAMACAVLFLGVPHGALDVLHARDSVPLLRGRHWAVFLALYVATALAVVFAWLVAPSVCLVGLLVVSGLHFSGDLGRGSPLVLRAVHGAAPVCLPALLHAAELEVLFSALAPVETARWLTGALELLSLPLLLVSGVATVVCARRHRDAVLEVAATAVVCSVASPLLGFSVYFCLLHSWRHVDRTRRIYQPSSTLLAWSAMLPTAATAVAAAVAWGVVEWSSMEPRLLQIVFIGLAALTAPHMLLIEKVRRRGWQPRRVVLRV